MIANSHLKTIVIAFLTFVSIGCVSYRDVVICVLDKKNTSPIANAEINLQFFYTMGRIYTEDSPWFQSGSTDSRGEFFVRVAGDTPFCIGVSKPGYIPSLTDIQKNSMDSGRLVIYLAKLESGVIEKKIETAGKRKKRDRECSVENPQWSAYVGRKGVGSH